MKSRIEKDNELIQSISNDFLEYDRKSFIGMFEFFTNKIIKLKNDHILELENDIQELKKQLNMKRDSVNTNK